MAAALRALGRRDHFREELRRKLLQKELDAAEVEAALGWCDARGYLDDERLARRFAARRAEDRGWGPRRIVFELERRGVERGLAESAVDAAVVTGRALSAALRRAEARAPAGWWRLPARRARMVSSLLARGFEASDAISAVGELARARENENHGWDDEPGDPVDLS